MQGPPSNLTAAPAHSSVLPIDDLLRDASEQERHRIEQAWPISRPVFERLIESSESSGETGRQLLDRLGHEARETLQRPGYQSRFRALLAADDNVKGRVLDIGCGPDLPAPLRYLPEVVRQLDGLDPSGEVLRHPHLRERWHATFEDAPVPDAAYDLAYAYNVLEHVERARPFMEKLARVLRPGATFWALTPHARHPFTILSRSLELLGLKQAIARRNEGVNPYPAYYRLNSRRQIRKALRGLPFGEPQFHYVNAPGWEVGYFPSFLRWAPRAYDKVLGERVEGLRLIL